MTEILSLLDSIKVLLLISRELDILLNIKITHFISVFDDITFFPFVA